MDPVIGVGVDCGLTGAIVALDHRRAVRTVLTASEWTRDGEYVDELMVRAVARLLEALAGERWLIVLEHQSCRPGQNVQSVFTNGTGFGLWRGLLASHSPLIVHPQRWQAVVHKGSPGKDPKARSRHVCRTVLPGGEWSDHNRADAACIALYGLHVLGALQ